MNKSLLDTDILSEILKGIDPTVARNAAAYRHAFGRYTLSSVTVMEVISGLQRNQSIRRVQKFLTDIGGEDVLAFGPSGRSLLCRRPSKISTEVSTAGSLFRQSVPLLAVIWWAAVTPLKWRRYW